MRLLLTFFCFLFISKAYTQNLEMDAELIELNFQGGSDVDDFFVFHNKVYFTAYDGTHGREIWVNDGETTTMLIDTISASFQEGGLIGKPIIKDDVFYFVGHPQNFSGLQKGLFKSDGTTEGTHLILADLENFIISTNFTGISPVGDELFFFYNDGIHGDELWKTDGTAENTSMVKDLNVGEGNMVLNNFKVVGNHYYFIANDGLHGNELWVSDGTESGTYLVKDIRSGPFGSEVLELFEYDNYVYFIANDGISGFELWRSDGTESGTFLVKDIRSGNNNAFDQYSTKNFIVYNNLLYFFANDGNRPQLWRTDGTNQGTEKFMDVNVYWINENTNLSRPLVGMALENEFLFVAYDHISGNNYAYKLWRSDGTLTGTYQIFDFEITASLFYYDFDTYQINDKSFISYNHSNYHNKSLWRTDGTTGGTQFLIGNYWDYSDLKSFGGATYFKAQIYFDDYKILKLTDDSTNPIEFMDNIINSNASYINFNNQIFYSNYFDNNEHYHSSGSELWKMNFDGSSSEMVKDINLGVPSNPSNYYKIFDKTIFYADNGKDAGLFLSDGSVNGTSFLKDINIYTNPGETETVFYPIGDQYFFKGQRQEEFAPYTLFKTDGTTEGTVEVSNEVITTNNSDGTRLINTVVNNQFYFVGNGKNLWVSDGTESGTYQVFTFPNEGNNYTLFSSMQAFGNYMYFTVSVNLGGGTSVSRGLWRTDGTTAGTEMIYEAPYEFYYSNIPPYIIGEINGKLVFEVENRLQTGFPDSFVDVFAIDESNQTPELIFTTFGKIYPGPFDTKNSINFNEKLHMPLRVYSATNEGQMAFLKTDGTPGGTFILNGSDFYSVKNPTICGNYLFFLDDVYSLWRTSGEMWGTVKLKEVTGFNQILDAECHKNNMYYSMFYYDESIPEYPEYSSALEITTGMPNQNQEITINRIDNQPIHNIRELYSDGELLYLAISENTHGLETYVANPNIILSTDEINEGLTNNSQIVLIYPNPTSSEINVVSNDNSKIQQIQLFDLTGKLVEIGVFNSLEAKLDMSKYNSGIYLLKVKTEKNTTTKKVVVK